MSSRSAHRTTRTTATSQYVELQVFSNFSFLRGASHPEELVAQAAALGYSALAITDYATLAGIVRAHRAAKEHGLKLITGATIALSKSTARVKKEDITEPLESRPHEALRERLPCSLTIYPTSITGYGQLCQLLTRGKRRSEKGQCILTLDDLADFSRELFVSILVHNSETPATSRTLNSLCEIFPRSQLSLGIHKTYGPDEQKRALTLHRLHQHYRIPFHAHNAVHFHCPSRKPLQDVLTCIRRRITLTEAGLLLLQNAERYLKAPQEMQRLFAALPQAVARSREIADAAAGFSLDQLRYEYPQEICPQDISPQEYLTQLVWQQAKERYPQGMPAKIAAQIRHELRLIEELSYAKYFLTVYDIVSFARSRGILCQGRGAAANSVVCFVLGITAVDPDQIQLLFERFVSKERNEPPDIDIDFEHERREEVIQYIYRKYGRHRAALAAAVCTYRSKSAVRDIGKVFSLSNEDIEAIQKVLSRDTPPYTQTLQARGLNPEDRAVQFTLELAPQLKGFPRHLTQHVGGFVISQTPLSQIVPIENTAMPSRTLIEWDKDDLESMGMLKIDILALGMLTCLRKAFAMLPEPLCLATLPREDPEVYAMICKADTIGVFQIESRAQMSMLPRLRPQCFYDLVIEVAIVRPGPIQGGMVHPFLRRRHGLEPVSYPSAAVREVLGSTLGVPIFQEQVMQLAIVAAGFTPGEADQLRRAMASWKRSKNALHAFEQRLIGGMRRNGYTLEFAQQVFQQILGFGEYGFPQSHAASFAHLVYASCWIKHHHPAVFTAALLNSQPMGYYQPAQLIEDARRHGVKVLPIDVRHSAWDCTLEKSAWQNAPALRLGMRLVHGLQRKEAEAIHRYMQHQKQTTSDIVQLWRGSGVRLATLKRLAGADAFRSFGLDRQHALWQLRTLRDSTLPLFEQLPGEAEHTGIETLPQLSAKAHLVRDYATTSFSLHAHPLCFLRERLKKIGTITAYELQHDLSFHNGALVHIAGIVLVRQRPMTASGVVFLTLEDETGSANAIIKPQLFERYRDVLCDSSLLRISGKLQRHAEVVHVLLQQAEDISPWFYSLSEEQEQLVQQSRDFR